MYYFLRVVYESSRLVVRALPKQYFEDTKQPIRTALEVKVPTEALKNVSTGTKLVCTDLKPASTMLTSSSVRVLDSKITTNKATKEEFEAYKIFMEGQTDEAIEEEIRAPKKTNTLFDKLRKDESLNKPTIEKEGFFVEDEVWYLLVRNIRSCINTMVTGPTGTGKSSLIMRAFKQLDIPLIKFDMSVMQDPISGLLGVHRLKGDSVFEYSRFAQAIQKPGGILLDEISRAPAIANNILFPVLDERRTLYCDHAGTHDVREIPVHEECMLIGTANIGAEYTGTFAMDEAFTNRYFVVELGYLNEENELKLLMKRHDIDMREARTIAKVCAHLREMFSLGEISKPVSTRESLMIAELVRDGMELFQSMKTILLPMYQGNLESGEKQLVNTSIMAR